MSHLISRGYPVSLVRKHLHGVEFSERQSAIQKKKQTAQNKIHNTAQRTTKSQVYTKTERVPYRKTP